MGKAVGGRGENCFRHLVCKPQSDEVYKICQTARTNELKFVTKLGKNFCMLYSSAFLARAFVSSLMNWVRYYKDIYICIYVIWYMLKAMRLDWIWISDRISINYYGNHAVSLIKFQFCQKCKNIFTPFEIWIYGLLSYSQYWANVYKCCFRFHSHCPTPITCILD